jgi:ribonuclease J
VSYEKLKDFPAPRILMLESLGVMKKEIKSEKEVQVNLETLVKQAQGRIILGTFASQIKRIKLLLQYAQKIGRKVALDGYSMRTNVEIAQQLGYLNVSKNLLIPINDIDKYPDNKILVLCTGAQGEHNAVLNRIVTDNHRFIKLKKTDTIVFSSSVIPGNERSVQRLKDNLYRKCDNVEHSDIMDIHMGGHATQGDIKEMIKFVQPQYFIPIYANYFMLKEAAKLAIEDGFPPKRIAILDNGSMIEFSKKGSRIRKEKADSSYVFVDGLGVGDIGHVVLRDRQMLSEDGMYVITVLIDGKTKEVVGNMQITSRGFIYVKDNFDLVNETKKKVKTIVKKTTSKDAKMDSRQVENEIRDRIGEYLFQKTQRRPMILPVVIEV